MRCVIVGVVTDVVGVAVDVVDEYDDVLVSLMLMFRALLLGLLLVLTCVVWLMVS